jgi:hypothetical protein
MSDLVGCATKIGVVFNIAYFDEDAAELLVRCAKDTQVMEALVHQIR